MKRTEAGDRLAGLINDHMHEAHRGARRGRGGVIVVFGNDGFDGDKRAAREVDAVLDYASANGLEAVDFGLDEGGYTWVVRLRAPRGERSWHVEQITNLLWRTWLGPTPSAEALIFERIQRGIAAGAIARGVRR